MIIYYLYGKRPTRTSMLAIFCNIPISSVQIFFVCNPLLLITLDVHAQHASTVSSRKLKTFVVSHPDRLCQCRGTRARAVAGSAVDTSNASIGCAANMWSFGLPLLPPLLPWLHMLTMFHEQILFSLSRQQEDMRSFIESHHREILQRLNFQDEVRRCESQDSQDSIGSSSVDLVTLTGPSLTSESSRGQRRMNILKGEPKNCGVIL